MRSTYWRTQETDGKAPPSTAEHYKMMVPSGIIHINQHMSCFPLNLRLHSWNHPDATEIIPTTLGSSPLCEKKAVVTDRLSAVEILDEVQCCVRLHL